MLPEIGASELLVIAVVALIVVGPKDLPLLLRRIGQFMAKLRNMASEFRASFDDMARQSELDDLRKEVEAMRRGATSGFADTADVASTVGEIEQSMADIGVQLHPPMSYQFTATDAAPPELAAPETPKPTRKRAASAAKPKAAAKVKTVPKTAASPKVAAKPKAAPKPKAKPIVEGGE
jgi:sec-independent protein translocase protein TatB